MKNKKVVSSVAAVILALICAVYAGVTNSNNEPATTAPASKKTVTTTVKKGGYVEGDTYTYKVTETSENTYNFRYKSNLDEHYKKHKADTHTSSKSEYLYRANYVINNKKSLHKTEKEDGDYIYYLASTNELVIVSKDGYIRTYFCPDTGKKYYDKQ